MKGSILGANDLKQYYCSFFSGFGLGSLVCDVFLCVCRLPIWCQVWYTIVSIPDICLLPYLL